MKDKNLPNNYDSLSLDELTQKIDKMIKDLEGQKNLNNSIEKYQNLLRLNNLVEKKFQKNIKDISYKSKENISKITSKKNAKRTK
tara:strand:- start:327 stop:581 length:255 start_codon:yes stop_codon:yes gene_type:complete